MEGCKKLFVSFGLLIAILLCIGVIVVVNLNTLDTKKQAMIAGSGMADYMSESKSAPTSDTRLTMKILVAEEWAGDNKWLMEHSRTVRIFEEFNGRLIDFAEEPAGQAEQLKYPVSYFNIGENYLGTGSRRQAMVAKKPVPVSSISNTGKPFVQLNLSTAADSDFEQFWNLFTVR